MKWIQSPHVVMLLCIDSISGCHFKVFVGKFFEMKTMKSMKSLRQVRRRKLQEMKSFQILYLIFSSLHLSSCHNILRWSDLRVAKFVLRHEGKVHVQSPYREESLWFLTRQVVLTVASKTDRRLASRSISFVTILTSTKVFVNSSLPTSPILMNIRISRDGVILIPERPDSPG